MVFKTALSSVVPHQVLHGCSGVLLSHFCVFNYYFYGSGVFLCYFYGLLNFLWFKGISFLFLSFLFWLRDIVILLFPSFLLVQGYLFPNFMVYSFFSVQGYLFLNSMVYSFFSVQGYLFLNFMVYSFF